MVSVVFVVLIRSVASMAPVYGARRFASLARQPMFQSTLKNLDWCLVLRWDVIEAQEVI